jgi:hypothetical protein
MSMISCCTKRAEKGTATVEAVLVLSVIVVFFALAPSIWRIWRNDLVARTEAHRDMFDKTTTFFQIPEELYTAAGVISEDMRRHIFPTFPPDLSNHSPFPTDLPNVYVEGWQRQAFRIPSGPLRADMQLFRYGAVIRSPWTWLGYPFIPTQDMIVERPKIASWYETEHDKTLDQAMIKSLKLWKK